MAAKHDAKRARENFWVMQQNMARQKSQSFVHKPRQPKAVPPAKAAAENAPAPSAETPEST